MADALRPEPPRRPRHAAFGEQGVQRREQVHVHAVHEPGLARRRDTNLALGRNYIVRRMRLARSPQASLTFPVDLYIARTSPCAPPLHSTPPAPSSSSAPRAALASPWPASSSGRGWNVVGTVEATPRPDCTPLADEHPGRVGSRPSTSPGPIRSLALRDRLRRPPLRHPVSQRRDRQRRRPRTMAQASTEEFVRVMVTNALAPLRVVEGLRDLVLADGLIGVMSSGQGSIGGNEKGGARRLPRQQGRSEPVHALLRRPSCRRRPRASC